jgi:sugar O-acyltransferase (sialic acid O-acetyltransferase NeuD family)
MKRLVIFGAGQIAQVADYCFTEDSGYEVVAFAVDADYLSEKEAFGRPLVAFEEVERRYPPDGFALFVAMGYGGLNRQRADKVAAARQKGYRLAHYVSSRAWVWKGFEARDNLFLLEHNTIQPHVRIGENTTLWSGNHIGHHTTIGDNVFIASHAVVSGSVTIGDDCFLGVNATIADNVTVGARCVVGAGALVTRDAPDSAVFAAAPTPVSKVPSHRLRGF